MKIVLNFYANFILSFFNFIKIFCWISLRNKILAAPLLGPLRIFTHATPMHKGTVTRTRIKLQMKSVTKLTRKVKIATVSYYIKILYIKNLIFSFQCN